MTDRRRGGKSFSRSRLKTGPAAPLALNLLVTLFEKTFAFAILAFHFTFACVLLHVLSISSTDADNKQTRAVSFDHLVGAQQE